MKQRIVYHHYFINSVLSSLIRGYADYFHNELFYPRSREIIIASYEKGVQHFLQRKNNAGEKMAPKYPFLVLDPMFDFEPDPQAGRSLWRYPNFAQGIRDYAEFEPPIYEDDNLKISALLNRYKGRMDLIVWCSSPYELMDFRHLLMNSFAGFDRPIYPSCINGYIVIPDDLYFYTYENPYDGQKYTINWTENKSEVVLLKNIALNKMVFPFAFRPYIKMVSCDDGSEKYGGSGDELSDYRLTVGLEWEAEVPSYIGLQASMRPDYSTVLYNGNPQEVKFHLDLDIGFAYVAKYEDEHGTQKTYNIPDNTIQLFSAEETDEYGEKTQLGWSDEVTFKEKYMYIITQENEDSIKADTPIDFSVTLTEDITDAFKVRIYAKYGELYRDHHWYVESPGVIVFKSFQLQSLRVGDIMWFAVYESNATPQDYYE